MATAVKDKQRPVTKVDWSQRIPEDQWSVYERAIEAAEDRSLPFLLGGAFALATYTGKWRNTKDLDFFVLPKDHEQVVAMLTGIGFGDYYEHTPYDRGWIYRSCQGEMIVDVIWQMANRRAVVDVSWFESATPVVIRGRTLHVLSAEDLIFCKLYVLQRDRCDWTDVLNVLYTVGPDLDWNQLLDRLGEDAPLLAGVMSVFTWLSPERACEIPAGVWRRLGLVNPATRGCEGADEDRVKLLDSRAWFGPALSPEQSLDV